MWEISKQWVLLLSTITFYLKSDQLIVHNTKKMSPNIFSEISTQLVLLLNTISFLRKVTNSFCITLKNVTKYYFVDKQRNMTSNGWSTFLISRSVPFRRNYSLRCLLMSLRVSSIQATSTDGFEIWHFRAFSQGENLLFFLKNDFFVLVVCTILYSARCCIHR